MGQKERIVDLWEETQVNLKAFGIVAGGAGVLAGLLYCLFRPKRLLPLQRLRPGAWTGREVFLTFFLAFLVPVLVRELLDSLGFFSAIFQKPSLVLREIWASPLMVLVFVAALFWLLYSASGTRPTHFGLTPSRWAPNGILGYLAFLLATPIVLGLYVAILWIIRQLDLPYSEHALQQVRQEVLRPIDWVMLFFRATIVAAVMEELMFRGVLLGWLRRASLVGHIVIGAFILLLGLEAFAISLVDLEEKPAEPNIGPFVFAIVLVGVYAWALYRVWGPVLKSGVRAFLHPLTPSPVQGRGEPLIKRRLVFRERVRLWQTQNAWLAILGSAALFGMVHRGDWPSQIPLVLLGFVLGWLAYRTQSLVGAIVLHCLFNTVACTVLLLYSLNSP
ncbi:MAG: CPBP family intramembrane metalloprotease [Gemmataceae bacterium]|nr:CPBP family intramembrane metalloprotease [Gemmataceae bacterium]